MQARHRNKAQRAALLGPVAKAELALRSDPALAARAAGTFAALAATGAIAGLCLALLAPRYQARLVWLASIGLSLLLGLALVALVLADRRHPARARRGQIRLFGALALLVLGTVIGAILLSTWPPIVAALIGLLAAAVGLAAGLKALHAATSAIHRIANEQRRGWHAQLRASRLTRRMIGMAAYRQLRRDGSLPVRSALFPQRTYLIPIRTTPSGARILVLENDRPIGGLCLRPREPLPDPEEALTHILAIRTDERAWLNRANFFPQDRALTPQALGLAAGRPGNYDR